jgi:hypothetical protein
VFAVVVSLVNTRTEDLERSGDRAPGVVTEVTNASRRRLNRRDVPSSIRVEFTYRGEARSERIHMESSEPDYDVGQQVVVLIDPDDPDRISIPGEANLSDWTEFLIFGVPAAGGVVGIVVGLMLLTNVRSQTRLLSTRPLGPPPGSPGGSSWPPRPDPPRPDRPPPPLYVDGGRPQGRSA